MKGLSAIFVAGLFILVMVPGCARKTAPVSSSLGMEGDKTIGRTETPPPDQEISPLPTIDESMPKGKTPPRDGQPISMEDVLFDYDSWSIRSDMASTLENNVFWLHNHPEAKILIEGHCDERGTEEYNLALGERRAKAAMEFIGNLGVDASRVAIISYGEEKPRCSEEDEACNMSNRRAHFTLQ